LPRCEACQYAKQKRRPTSNLGMDLEEEDSVAGFLGVLIQRHSGTTPTIELLQTGLIQRIVDALQISHLPPKRTPAKVCVLSSALSIMPRSSV
jgi:hypothetical protein